MSFRWSFQVEVKTGITAKGPGRIVGWGALLILRKRLVCVSLLFSRTLSATTIMKEHLSWTLNMQRLRFVTRFKWLQQQKIPESRAHRPFSRHHVSDGKFIFYWVRMVERCVRVVYRSSIFINTIGRRMNKHKGRVALFSPSHFECVRLELGGGASTAGQILIRNTWQIF